MKKSIAPKITKKELEDLRATNAEFTRLKNTIADLEMSKYSMIKRSEELQAEFQVMQAKLTEKYGKTAVINLQDGSITHDKPAAPVKE